MVMKDRWRMSPGLRRTSAVVAIAALAIGGAKIASDHTMPGSGFSTVATVAADPTGPPGPTGGMTDGGGSQFQPPQMPSSMPDYQGGNNQPPLDQNNGISIYNSGNPQAPQQVPGQQAGQQPQQAQQPAHGTQIPDYQTATPYTQGPGKANPDYQAPQQGNQAQQPQQGQQPQQQPQQRQPDQQPQNKQDQDTQQLNERQQKCQAVAQSAGVDLNTGEALSTGLDLLSMANDGAGSLLDGPSRGRIDPRTAPDPGPVAPGGGCSICPPNSVEHYNYENGELTKLDTGPTTYNIDNLKKSMAGMCIGPTEQATGKCVWGDAGRCLAAVGVLGSELVALKGSVRLAQSIAKAAGRGGDIAKKVKDVAEAIGKLFDEVNKIPSLTLPQKVVATITAALGAKFIWDDISELAEKVGGLIEDVAEVPKRCSKLF